MFLGLETLQQSLIKKGLVWDWSLQECVEWDCAAEHSRDWGPWPWTGWEGCVSDPGADQAQVWCRHGNFEAACANKGEGSPWSGPWHQIFAAATEDACPKLLRPEHARSLLHSLFWASRGFFPNMWTGHLWEPIFRRQAVWFTHHSPITLDAVCASCSFFRTGQDFTKAWMEKHCNFLLLPSDGAMTSSIRHLTTAASKLAADGNGKNVSFGRHW